MYSDIFTDKNKLIKIKYKNIIFFCMVFIIIIIILLGNLKYSFTACIKDEVYK